MPSKRIIGPNSVIANSTDYPFLVSLQSKRNGSENCYEHFCGGTMISENFVLTAAHCFWGNVDPNTKWPRTPVYVSHHPQCRHQNDLSQERIAVNKIFMNPSYDVGNEYGDLAILELMGKYDGLVIELDLEQKDFSSGSQAKVVGYGYVRPEEAGKYVVQPLREATLYITQESTCQDLLTMANMLPGFFDYNTMVCAHNLGADTCDGDSGGPLLQADTQGNFKQIGIVSWGPQTQCKNALDSQAPTVFTRLPPFKDWINEIVGSQAQGWELQDEVPLSSPKLDVPASPQFETLTQITETTIYPFNTIGTFSYQGCSGFMIEDRFVLTAASCVWDSKSEDWFPNLEFTPGKNGTRKPFGSFNSIIALTPFEYKLNQNPSLNYALIVLDHSFLEICKNVRQDDCSFFERQDECGREMVFNLAGYREDEKLWVSPCQDVIPSCSQKIIDHWCEAAVGMVGAPLWRFQKTDSTQKHVVYGINTGTNYKGEEGSAVYLNQQNWDTIQSWIDQTKANF